MDELVGVALEVGLELLLWWLLPRNAVLGLVVLGVLVGTAALMIASL